MEKRIGPQQSAINKKPNLVRDSSPRWKTICACLFPGSSFASPENIALRSKNLGISLSLILTQTVSKFSIHICVYIYVWFIWLFLFIALGIGIRSSVPWPEALETSGVFLLRGMPCRIWNLDITGRSSAHHQWFMCFCPAVLLHSCLPFIEPRHGKRQFSLGRGADEKILKYPKPRSDRMERREKNYSAKLLVSKQTET